MQVEVLNDNSVESIIKEIAEFEIDIAGLESIEISNDNPEQSSAITDRIIRSKEKIQELVEIKESYTNFYKDEIGMEFGNTSKAVQTMGNLSQDHPTINDVASNQSFIQEINVTFEETRQDVDGFMKQMINQGVQHVNKTELETILEKHLQQVESVIRNSMSAVDSMMNPTENQIQSETKMMKRSIVSVLEDLKNNIKQYFATKKENTVNKIRNTKEDVRLGFKNSFNRKILTINGLLKQLSNKIDQKFVIEEKQTRSNQVEVSNNQANTSQQSSREDLSAPQVETNTPGTTTANEKIQASTEKQLEEFPPSAETNQSSVTEIVEGNDQSNNEIQAESAEENPPQKEMNNIELQQMKRIEELSDQLGMKPNKEEKTSIKELSQAQKAELIRSMEDVVEEKSKSIAAEEAELEVG